MKNGTTLRTKKHYDLMHGRTIQPRAILSVYLFLLPKNFSETIGRNKYPISTRFGKEWQNGISRVGGEQWKMVAKAEGRVGCRGCARLRRSIFHFSFANQLKSKGDKNYLPLLVRVFSIQPLYST